MGAHHTIRSASLADTLVEGLTDGTPLRVLCRDSEVSKSAVYDWMEDDAEFAGRIARARERGYHQIADETLEIADDKTEEAQSRKVRIETRLKLLAKWSPKLWGDRVEVEHSGAIQTQTDEQLDARLSALMAKAT